MITQRPQAISGVSSTYENVIEELYPSIAATSLGRYLGNLYEGSSLSIGLLKITHLIFVPLTWPLGLLTYFLLKIFGSRYTVTNRQVKIMASLGFSIRKSVNLGDIADIIIDESSRLAFFRSGDLYLTNAAGESIMVLEGVPYPDRFRNVILESRDARRFVEQSLATITARSK